jgi:hypothetical protein
LLYFFARFYQNRQCKRVENELNNVKAE